jgi:hypothetical protein
MHQLFTEKQHGVYIMKAIAVSPGKPDWMHLEEIPVPKISDIPNRPTL